MGSPGTAPKATARVAMLGLDEASRAILADSFRQFGIDTVAAAADAPLTGDFNAFVLPLPAADEGVLRRLREWDPHTVIYGICGSVREAVRFSEYGINAVFETPVQRQAALAVVRATHLLVLRELRRYVRVPLLSGVELQSGADSLSATSIEISAGGMALRVSKRLQPSQTLTASFELPGAATITVQSVVSWINQSEGTVGIRFDPGDPHRSIVRRWVDEYLRA